MALQRLDAEDAELKEEIKSRVEQRSGVDERVSEAEATLAAAEKLFAELTTALADLTAKRNQLEASVRTHRDRLARLDQEIANVESDEQKLAQETGGLGDLAALADRDETAQQVLAQAEAAAQTSEAAHVAARQKLEAARAPLTEADKRVQRLETEARTISKIVNGETKNLWPPIIDGVHVAKGYEKALGAALGDDLDAPVDPSAPMRWTDAGVAQAIRRCPTASTRSPTHVEAPSELARRLAQIGVVGQGARRRTGVAAEDRPAAGVARRRRLALGRLCRRGPCADRRGAAARRARPPRRHRNRARAGAHRRAPQAAGAGDRPKPTLKAAATAETAAREAWRAAQREADAARERHAAPSARSTATPRASRR